MKNNEFYLTNSLLLLEMTFKNQEKESAHQLQKSFPACADSSKRKFAYTHRIDSKFEAFPQNLCHFIVILLHGLSSTAKVFQLFNFPVESRVEGSNTLICIEK